MSTIPNTLNAFKWLFRDTALWAVDEYSPAGGIDAVRRALGEMGILNMPIGPGVLFRNRYDLVSLPNQTVLSFGQPIKPADYNVWVMRNRTPCHVLGNGYNRGRYTICEMPGGERPAWLDDDTEDGLEEFRRTAWEIGYKYKVDYSWCGSFENVVNSLGVYSR